MGKNTNLANLITIGRLIPLGLVVLFLYLEAPPLAAAAVVLILLLQAMDYLDGLVARRIGQVTRLGSALDIAVDRLVEFVLWVCFADLDLVPVWVPLIVIARGLIVDALRSYALSMGQTPFGMMHSRLGKFLVSSVFMRHFYGIVKMLAFLTLGAVHALDRGAWPALWGARPWLYVVAYTWTMLTLGLCLLRGVPVLFDAPQVFRRQAGGQG